MDALQERFPKAPAFLKPLELSKSSSLQLFDYALFKGKARQKSVCADFSKT
jgi:hypothetical protein